MPRVSKIRAEKTLKKITLMRQAMLNGNPKRTKQIDEFIDKDHSVSAKFYDLVESYEVNNPTLEEVVEDMKKLVKNDPNFLDPYLYIAEAYYRAEDYDRYLDYIYKAYWKALHKVATKNGTYPKHLAWGWAENRHIIRSLNNFALMMWESGDERLSLEIYRKLLKSDPHDNIGARFSILALRMGYKSDYEELFLPKSGPTYGLDAVKMSQWFDDNSKDYPEEFNDWIKYAQSFDQ